jgi:Zn finger protein HypA/HybF involved in hydrogenase expression
MKCKKCNGESWEWKELFFWRCPNCNNIQIAPGKRHRDLKLELKLAEKRVRDLKYLLGVKK